MEVITADFPYNEAISGPVVQLKPITMPANNDSINVVRTMVRDFGMITKLFIEPLLFFFTYVH